MLNGMLTLQLYMSDYIQVNGISFSRHILNIFFHLPCASITATYWTDRPTPVR